MLAAVFTVNTKAYAEKKGSAAGKVLKQILEQAGFQVKTGALPQERDVVETVLRKLADTGAAKLIFTVGANGCREEDCAPEAVAGAAERLLPGIPEAVRAWNAGRGRKLLLDRSAAGIRNKTIMVNLTDDEKLAKESLEYILPELTQAAEAVNE